MAFRSPLIRNNHFFNSTRPSPPQPSRPSVVSIPIQFVNSDATATAAASATAKIRAPLPEKTRSAAAIKIQKAIRGFLVRKNVKIVRKVEAEVKEIERKMEDEEEMGLVAKDEKERLKINEMLMALLLRLDSVRGVRDYRRKVIRKVIELQEMVDSISAKRSCDQSADSQEIGTLESGDVTIEEAETVRDSEVPNPVEIETLDTAAVESQETETLASCDVVMEELKTLGDSEVSNPGEIKNLEDGESKSAGAIESAAESEQVETPQVTDPVHEIAEQSAAQDVKLESGAEISSDWDIIDMENEENQESSAMNEAAAAETVKMAGDDVTVESKEKQEKDEEREKMEKQEMMMVDVMEKMVAENEKLKGLVAELCQRSALQCRLMGGLAERVENLERVVEKMEKRRKKKRKDGNRLLDTTSTDRKKQLQ